MPRGHCLGPPWVSKCLVLKDLGGVIQDLSGPEMLVVPQGEHVGHKEGLDFMILLFRTDCLRLYIPFLG